MFSKVVLLLLGVLLVSQASKIPEWPYFTENVAEKSSDLSLANSEEIDDELPSDVKFNIAKLVRGLLDKLRGILEKCLDFAENHFHTALKKANGAINRIEDLASSKIEGILEALKEQTLKIIDQARERGVNISDCVRPLEEKLETSLEQLLQDLDRDITEAIDGETVKMWESLNKIKKTISEVEIEPCEGSPLHEFECWMKELTRVTKALLYIPTQISKQTVNNLADIGSLSITIVWTAQRTVRTAESMGINYMNDIKKCIPPVK